jgi:guanylate kinase
LGLEGFREQIEKEAFIEWEEVYTNNFYGTLKSEIERIWANGKIVIFDLDVIGGLNLKRIFGEQALSIFVKPPSYEELEKRLRSRSTETEDKIQQRMDKANAELAYAPNFDIILINDDLEETCKKAKEMVSNFTGK